MGVDYVFEGRKDREPESMSNEESIKFQLFTEKKITSFRSMTEM